MKILGPIVLILALLPLAAVAQTSGCWFFDDYSTAALACPGPVSIVVLPDGSGDPLTAARTPSGAIVDATLTLTLRDCWDEPIPNFPAEDLWLESADGGLVPCVGGSIADANTDALGVATWTNPLLAGGHSEAGCSIVINGTVLFSGQPLALRFNSPDLNGDLAVNLSDVAIFVGDYWGPYRFRSDFSADGVLNLSDVSLMVQAVGSACP